MKQLNVDGRQHDIEFRFFSSGAGEEQSLCLVKSKLTEYPVIMGKQPDGSWDCVAHAPVVIAQLKNDLSRAIIDYKILKEAL